MKIFSIIHLFVGRGRQNNEYLFWILSYYKNNKKGHTSQQDPFKIFTNKK